MIDRRLPKALAKWMFDYQKLEHNMIRFDFEPNLVRGSGKNIYNGCNELCVVLVGTSDPIEKSNVEHLSNTNQKKPSDNLRFIQMMVTLHHEYRHYKQLTADNTPKEILLSSLSICGNDEYYQTYWNELPHEINAEFCGVMQTWSRLEETYPKGKFYQKRINKYMFEYLTNRASKGNYMFEVPKDGFRSKEQVIELFKEAYEKALIDERTYDQNILFNKSDEMPRIIKRDDSPYYREYAYFSNKLITAPNGQEQDRMMSSLVAYVHPKLQNTFSKLSFDELDPEHVFGKPLPESSTKLQKLLHIEEDKELVDDDQFAERVLSIPDKESDCVSIT